MRLQIKRTTAITKSNNATVNKKNGFCNSVTMCVFVLRVLTCCGFMCFLCVCVIIGLCACVDSLKVLIVC